MVYIRESSTFASNPERYPTLAKNWMFSYETINGLRSNLETALSGEIFTVAVAGSLGRMEACALSDVDYIVLSYEEHDTRKDLEKLREVDRINSNQEVLISEHGARLKEQQDASRKKAKILRH